VKGRRSFRAISAATGALLLASVVGGCGFGAGDSKVDSNITVTSGFGAKQVGSVSKQKLPESETVLRLLQREFKVQTGSGGNFVTAIGSRDGGKQLKSSGSEGWFYFVNGIQGEVGAGEQRLTNGDQVWWDHHSWAKALDVPAVVGSFPEPFRSGINGKKLPVRIDCAKNSGKACDTVNQQLKDASVKAGAKGAIGQAAGEELLRLVVGQWKDVSRDPVVHRLLRGPGVTGVFARPTADGKQFELLSANGTIVQKVGGNAGLIAATRFEKQAPTWIITGTSAAGVQKAAESLTAKTLRNRFAVVVDGGRTIPLPALSD
jgi:hypothetical protein